MFFNNLLSLPGYELTGLMYSTAVNHPTSIHTECLGYTMEPNTAATHYQQSTGHNNPNQTYDHIGAQFFHSLQDGYNAIENTLCRPSGIIAPGEDHCNCATRNSPSQSTSNSRLTVENLATHERLMHCDPVGKFDENIKCVLAAAKCLQLAKCVDATVKLGELGKLPVARWAESPEDPFSKTVVPQG